MTVQDIRSFNRFYTNVIGALDYSRHLYAPYTLTESRVLYELVHPEQGRRLDAADLRARLNLDAGYLSRILGKFERDGLVERGASEHDSRRRSITLTPRGRTTAELLDERSREAVGALLDTVPAADRGRLAQALRTVRTVLGDGRAAAPRSEDVTLRDPGPGDLGWIVARNGAVYAAEFGWNAEYEGLVARVVADFAQDHDPYLERVWIAELDGRAVGCVMCVRDEAPGTARLRLLLVEPEARGLGVGDRLVRAVIDFARGVGYRELVLWTNDVLTSARSIYRRHGFVLAGETPHRSFGVDLTGQDWRLPLQQARE
ncbi:helix-turn-helix domain-containing GNAT family N-acetyltransferase [Streptomyces kunmingensis]|uniref:Helix-turn-helix domain-containing GNAT family N-acetyltransferase n=1 Tax=Streptomyces kunmingensis TaxID=68225 RepID=A0ABU6CKR3_9ACTN|nr:bifunctional helix-turn-helix transcriptional regulator/GNAT family N-acetyltransferase [Streptomyces kunmingensis]MEB3965320.1 helix-turn-helix domain-containing GNAT family N-acetyltransferase [Streptomyces kunmingensis]